MIPEKVLAGAVKCLDIWQNGKNLDDILDSSFKDSDRELRSMISSILFIYFRKKAGIEYIINRFVKKKIEPLVKKVIAIALVQIFFQDGIPGEIAVDVAVDYVKKLRNKKVGGFVNAVLRNAIRETYDKILLNAPENVKLNIPELLYDRWKCYLSEEDFLRVVDAIGEKADFTFRLLKEVDSSLLEACVCTKLDNSFLPDKFLFYQTDSPGLLFENNLNTTDAIYIQDPATGMAVSLTDGLKAESVLDVCSAPGGKALMLSELFPNAQITAADRSLNRLKRVDENIRRIGRKNIITVVSDALKPNLRENSYDIVFADVPCSNTGVIRRRPDVLWRFTEKHLSEILSLQADILDSISRLVKKGGYLIYSTCSIEKDENRMQVDKFIRQNKDFELIKDKLLLPGKDNDGAYGALLIRIAE